MTGGKTVLLLVLAACFATVAVAEGVDATGTAAAPAEQKIAVVESVTDKEIKKETKSVQEDELNFMPVRIVGLWYTYAYK